MIRSCGIILVLLTLNGCVLFSSPEPTEVIIFENAVHGTVTETWAEPMVDSVEVPAQLDPMGTYYRLPHRTIVEIRPGRYQEIEYPDDLTK